MYVLMVKTRVDPLLGPLDNGQIYKGISDEFYKRLRSDGAARKLKETDAVRKAARPLPTVEGGGAALAERRDSLQDLYDDEPLPPDPPAREGIIELPMKVENAALDRSGGRGR